MPLDLTMEHIIQHVEAVLTPLARDLGLDIVEFKVKGHTKDIQIQVFADLPLGGIGVDECIALNQALVAGLEDAKVLDPETFSVEVSSPGLDRPLKSSKDFLRNLNYNIRLYLKEPIEGKKEAVGLLTQATEETVTIVNKKKQDVVIKLDIIERGLLIL